MHDEYYEMTDEEIEAAWQHSHANGITAGPVSSIDYAVDLVMQTQSPLEKAVKLLTILAGVYSIPQEELQEAIKHLKRQKR
jgi:hypothetical protein